MHTFKYINSSIILVAIIFLAACTKYDNFDPPSSKFTGHVVYKGSPIQVKSNGSGSVYFELWQTGFGKIGSIPVALSQDGGFSALLFNGDYKLIFPSSKGPFMSSRDTMPLSISGDKNLDIEVTPYYLINNPSFKLNKDSTVAASCSIAQIITGADSKNIEYVDLFVNRTTFVDDENFITNNRLFNISNLNNVTFNAKIPKDISWNSQAGVGQQTIFFARIGLKISGRDDLIFTPVQKLSL